LIRCRCHWPITGAFLKRDAKEERKTGGKRAEGIKKVAGQSKRGRLVARGFRKPDARGRPRSDPNSVRKWNEVKGKITRKRVNGMEKGRKGIRPGNSLQNKVKAKWTRRPAGTPKLHEEKEEGPRGESEKKGEGGNGRCSASGRGSKWGKGEPVSSGRPKACRGGG